MHRNIRWLAIGALGIGALAALGCASDPPEGVGGAATTSNTASTSSTTTSASSTTSTGSSATTSSGSVSPCVLDSSNLDACGLQ